jgi:histidinol phosphatase-like enzyme
MTFAVDFDGTCVAKTKDYPRHGENNPGAVKALKNLKAAGHKIILWTCRDGAGLMYAIQWFAGNSIELDSVNSNSLTEKTNLSVKIDADFYIDDKALGCPMKNGMVDWERVLLLIEEEGK